MNNLLKLETKDLLKFDKFTAVYTRVSTGNQDIQKQSNSINAYINTLGIKEARIYRFADDNISAYKLKINQRPDLVKLISHIKQGNIDNLIVYHRDRLARNFYEYVEIVKLLKKYNVNVHFTAEAQPPFSDLVFESFYGIMAHKEGDNISARLGDTSLQYPNNVLGYKRIGKRSEVVYKPDSTNSLKLVSFFKDVSSVNSAEELFEVFIRHKGILKKSYRDLFKYVSNPFYCGRMRTRYGDESLKHVTELISYDLYLKNRKILDTYDERLVEAIDKTERKNPLNPWCHYCNKPMSFRSGQLGEWGYYSCRKKHSPIILKVDEYSESIKENLKEIINKIPADTIKLNLFEFLDMKMQKEKVQNTKYTKKIEQLLRKITETHINFPSASNIGKFVEEKNDIQKNIRISNDKIAIYEEAKDELEKYIIIVKETLSDELLNFNQESLTPLLFYKIEVTKKELIYHITFADYFKEGSVSND